MADNTRSAEFVDCTCGHAIASHDAEGCFPACGCSRPGPAQAADDTTGSVKHGHPADGTEVRLKPGMPGTLNGQWATVRYRHPVSGSSNLPTLVWLQTEVIWSHGTADGFWAMRAEYIVPEEGFDA